MTPVNCRIPQVCDLVPRTRLLNLLAGQDPCRIFLITGQAAQGKSTLVASFLKKKQQESLWCHLTSEASDHTTLFDILINEIDQLLKHRADQPADRKRKTQKIQIPQTTLGTRHDLLRQVETLSHIFEQIDFPLNLVLDDMEALDEQGSAFSLIERLVQKPLWNVRFFLISRTLPPLNLPKLKINQPLFAVTNEDLAFTLDETLAFFQQKNSMGPEDIQKIFKITEGWAGGLVLVSEALRRTQGVENLPGRLSSEAFSYFYHEIYNTLPPETRRFLMETSIFDLLDTRILKDFFTDINALLVLRQLEQRNLFIQKINPDTIWPIFKYNHLFRDFLKADLLKHLNPGEYETLYKKAGQVFWENKSHDQALGAFIAAKAFSEIAKIIRIKGIDYVITGKTTRLSEAIKALPEDMVNHDPWLFFFKTLTHRIKGGKQNIHDFCRALDIFKQAADNRGILLCTAYLIEATVFVREPSQVILKWINQGEACLKSRQGKHKYTWAIALLWQQVALGYIAGNGDIPRGISACRNAILLARQIKDSSLLLNASVVLTLGFVQSGDFSGARQMLEKIQGMTQEGSHPEYRALKNITNIDYALKKGDFEPAKTLLKRIEQDVEKFSLIFLYPGLVEARAVYFIATEQFTQALQTADHLSDFSILEGNNFYLGIAHRIRATIFLKKEMYEDAHKEVLNAVNSLKQTQRGDIHLFLARKIHGFVLFHLGNFSEAQRQLEPVLDYFHSITSDLIFCEISFILGLIAFSLNQTSRGEAHLAAGLQKAVESNYSYFPLIDLKTLARVLVCASMIKSIPIVSADPTNPAFPSGLISTRLSVHLRQAIVEFLDRIKKKDKPAAADRLRALYRISLPKIRINTLGEFTVLVDKTPMDKSVFEGSKPISLLKAILLNGYTDIHKEILIDALWPDVSPASGNKNFKINLHRLRKALEPDPVKAFGYTYVIQKAARISLDTDLISLDTDEFLDLETKATDLELVNTREQTLAYYSRAAEIYRGDYFADDPYLEWIGHRREWFRSKHITILEKKALLHEDLNQWQEAMETWRTIIQTDPTLEEAYQNMMILYADAGRKNEAIQVFNRCKTNLKTELDAEPDSQTVDLYKKIKAL